MEGFHVETKGLKRLKIKKGITSRANLKQNKGLSGEKNWVLSENGKNNRNCGTICEDLLGNRKGLSLRSFVSSPGEKRLGEGVKNLKELAKFNKKYEEEVIRYYVKYQEELQKVNKKKEFIRSGISELKDLFTFIQNELEKKRKVLSKIEQNIHLGRYEPNTQISPKKIMAFEEAAQEIKEYSDLAEGLDKEIASNSKTLKKIEKDCVWVRSELDSIKRSLVEYLKQLLKEGKDSRNEGLQWIVKSIFKLGGKVGKPDFCYFLDDGLIELIMKLSEKSLEIDKFAVNVPLRNPENNDLLFNNKGKFTEIHLKLAELLKISENRCAKLMKLGENKNKGSDNWADNGGFKGSEKKGDFQHRLNDLNNEIERIKEEGIQRIMSKQYGLGYTIRMKIELKWLVGALVGLENANNYSSDIIKMKRDISEKSLSPNLWRYSLTRERVNYGV